MVGVIWFGKKQHGIKANKMNVYDISVKLKHWQLFLIVLLILQVFKDNFLNRILFFCTLIFTSLGFIQII